MFYFFRYLYRYFSFVGSTACVRWCNRPPSMLPPSWLFEIQVIRQLRSSVTDRMQRCSFRKISFLSLPLGRFCPYPIRPMFYRTIQSRNTIFYPIFLPLSIDQPVQRCVPMRISSHMLTRKHWYCYRRVYYDLTNITLIIMFTILTIRRKKKKQKRNNRRNPRSNSR